VVETIREPGLAMERSASEAELLEGVKNSNLDDFRMLFERHQPAVFRSVLYRLHDPELAHDIVQETFLKIWEHRTTLNPDLSFMAFALRIATNRARDVLRHKSTRERLKGRIPRPELSERDDPEAALQRTMLEQKLVSIINDKLPERCRTIFLLSRFERKSTQQIADLLGVSGKTVENQINRALKVLRRNLGEFF
jgi:RNA polymerase sigma-70 factor (ECF subfamily)